MRRFFWLTSKGAKLNDSNDFQCFGLRGTHTYPMISSPGDQIILSSDRKEQAEHQTKRQSCLKALVSPQPMCSDCHADTCNMRIKEVWSIKKKRWIRKKLVLDICEMLKIIPMLIRSSLEVVCIEFENAL